MTGPGAIASTDVVIVGGGIVGAACAYELASSGVSVVLCEKSDLADGASGRNPGFVWMHTRRPGAQLQLSRRTRARYDTLPEEIEHDFDLRRNGGLIVFHTPVQHKVMAEFVDQRQREGVDVVLLDGDEARELCPILPADVLGASFCREDAQITTRKLVEGLARAAERHGATILRGTEVGAIAKEGERVTGVTTLRGRIDAGAVVLAAGVWSPMLAASLGLDLPIRPMRLQIVATAVAPPLLSHLLYGPQAIRQYDIFHGLPSYRDEDFLDEGSVQDELPFLELACQTSDGRFLLGCPMDLSTGSWEPDLEGVASTCRRLLDMVPALRGLRFDRAWAGLLPHTNDSLPVIDQVPGLEGAFVAAGHVFGNSSAIATAELIAARVRHEPPPFTVDDVALGRPGLEGDGSRW